MVIELWSQYIILACVLALHVITVLGR